MQANSTTLMGTAVMNAAKAALSAGAGTKKLQIYSSTIPATAGAAITTQVKLLEFAIDPGSWDVVDGDLIIPESENIAAIATGIARWARFVDGNGAVVMDVDVTASGGNGFVRLSNTAVVAGGDPAPTYKIVPGSIRVA